MPLQLTLSMGVAKSNREKKNTFKNYALFNPRFNYCKYTKQTEID